MTPTLRALITPGRPDAQARACPAEYMDRFSTTFIERRQQALQRFLDRIALHSLLRKSDNLRLFLEAKAWVRGSVPGVPRLRQELDAHVHEQADRPSGSV